MFCFTLTLHCYWEFLDFSPNFRKPSHSVDKYRWLYLKQINFVYMIFFLKVEDHL